MSDSYELEQSILSRRDLLAGAAGAAAGAALLGPVARAGAARVAREAAAATDVRRGGVLQIAIGDAAVKDNLDPAESGNTFESVVNAQLYEGLVAVDDKWNIHPLLAEEWDSNATGTEWTFRLRTGITFHDGSPLTARDVAYSLRRLLDKKVASPLYGRLTPSLAPGGIEVVDSRTVRLRLKQKDVFLPIALGQRQARIVRKGTTDFKRRANGTGPFRLKSFVPGRSFELERNPRYWQRGRPFLDGVRGVVVAEEATKVQSVLAGQSHLSDPIDFKSVPTVTGNRRGKFFALREAAFVDAAVDVKVPPFNDKRVRKALKLAVNRKRILDVALQGFGSLASDAPVPRSDPFLPRSLRSRTQDIATARRLLAEAGFPGGIDVKLATADAGLGMVDFAVVVAETVRPAGIRVTVDQRPTATYWDQVWLKAPAFVAFWTRRHPSDMLPVGFTSNAVWNEGNFRSKKLDSLTLQAQRTTNAKLQRKLYHEAMQLIADEGSRIIPVFASRLWVAKTTVNGVALSNTRIIEFKNASIR